MHAHLPEGEKIDVSPHVLRHTFLRKLAETKGVPLNLYQFVVRGKGRMTSARARKKTSKALIYQAKVYNWLDYEAMHIISVGSKKPWVWSRHIPPRFFPFLHCYKPL